MWVRSPSFFLDSLPKRKANCPVVSRSLVTVSSQRFIWVIQFSSVVSRVRLFGTPLSQWCHPTISSSIVPFCSCLQPFPVSGSFLMSLIRIRWPKYSSFTFSNSPFNEYSGLISFTMDWLDLLALQGTQSLHHHSYKASILQCSAFFIAQLCHPYMTPGKTIPLTTRTFVGKIISVIFNMLSKFVITFLPRNKRL